MAPRGPHGTTRRKILELLRQHGRLAASDLAAQLGISAVAVRQHLAQLQREGLITLSGARQSAGRPSQLFTLTPAADQMFPRGYERLALDLLSCVGQQNPNAVDQLFAARQQLLAHRYESQLAGLPLEERVAKLAHMLTEQGYMAEHYELEDGSLVLVQHNCPIAQVALDYRQACTCEHALYEQVLETPVTNESTIVRGATCCCYRITR